KNSKTYLFDAMRSAYRYKDRIRKLILKFKYSGRTYLAADFAAALAKKAKEEGFAEKADIVVPVPSHLLRRIKRGYNQAELLARETSKLLNIPHRSGILLRKKLTKPQFKLSKTEREENIKDSFFVAENAVIKGKNILLIDDIATTGATASACAGALKKAGAKKVFVLTLARD
ncbi:MAG: ComF family protein, partial [Endomicrobia bacterium]|nr:ComF family protein [Endomicrobiia bacterium]